MRHITREKNRNPTTILTVLCCILRFYTIAPEAAEEERPSNHNLKFFLRDSYAPLREEKSETYKIPSDLPPRSRHSRRNSSPERDSADLTVQETRSHEPLLPETRVHLSLFQDLDQETSPLKASPAHTISSRGKTVDELLSPYLTKNRKLEEIIREQSRQIAQLTADREIDRQNFTALQNLIELRLLKGEFQTDRHIALGNEFKICLVLAGVSTFMVYMNPGSLWDSPFIFFYFLGSYITTFKFLKDLGRLSSKMPPLQAMEKKQ